MGHETATVDATGRDDLRPLASDQRRRRGMMHYTLTAKDIKARLEDVPDDADIFWYLDESGIEIKAEWPGGGCQTLVQTRPLTNGGTTK